MFGPVMTAQPFSDEEEALAAPTAWEYALAS